MKILLAGSYSYFWYEEVCAKALERAGHVVVRFSWATYFADLFGRVEQRFLMRGPKTRSLERELLRTAIASAPDVIWIWRGIHLRPNALKVLKQKTGALLVSFNNDDPFGPGHSRRLLGRDVGMWRCCIAAIPTYDMNFVYRPSNVADYRRAGARHVGLLPPYFINEVHYPRILRPEQRERYGCDVVFIGHYEDDGRADVLKQLRERGIHLRLFGTGWPDRAIERVFGSVVPVRPAYGEEYVVALRGAKMCLAFFSRLNRDVYTRRSFEIPACGCVMVSEYSASVAKYFLADVEALYFSNTRELLSVVEKGLADEARLTRIAAAGRARCLSSRYDVDGRMAAWVEEVRTFRERDPRSSQ